MSELQVYEEVLRKRYHLPDRRCIYNPSVYFMLTKQEQDTIQTLRRNN